MKRLNTFITLTLLMLTLCACSADKPQTLDLDINEFLNDNATPTSAMKPVAARDIKYQHVYMLQWSKPSAQKIPNERASQLAQAAGFKLIFDVSNVRDYDDGSGQYSIETAMEEDSDGVTLLYKNMLPEDLHTGDCYKQAAEWSPNYLARAESLNYPGTLRLMPIGMSGFPKRPAVFIRDDVYKEYGSTIKNSRDLEELLIWLQKMHPGGAPCLDWSIDSPFVGLELFLPEMGYTSLQSVFVDTANTDTVLWMDENTGNISAFYDMPDSAEAIKHYYNWVQNGLLDIASYSSKLEDYPVVLIDTGDLNAVNSSRVPKLLESMAGYTLNVFSYPENYYASTDWLAVAPAGVDISEFLRFMEWLEADIANYMYFIYGIEGVDYGEVSGGYIDRQQANQLITTSYFRRRDYETQIAKNDYKITGYPQALSVEPVTYAMDAAARYDIGKKLAVDSYYKGAILNCRSKLIELKANLFLLGGFSDIEAEGMIYETFKSICELDKLDIAERLMRGEEQ